MHIALSFYVIIRAILSSIPVFLNIEISNIRNLIMADAGKSIADQIKEQGELVRKLKAEKAGIDKVYEILTWISIAET